MSERFDVYLHGFDPEHPEPPQQGLLRMFGLDAAQTAQLIVSLPRTVKHGLSGRDAERYLLALQSVGGKAELRSGASVSAARRAVEPSLPPVQWSSATTSAWADPLSSTMRPPPRQADVASVAPSSTLPERAQAPSGPAWIASAHIGVNFPPRSAAAPTLPVLARRPGVGMALVAAGVAVIFLAYGLGSSSLLPSPHGALALQLLGVLLLGRGLLRPWF